MNTSHAQAVPSPGDRGLTPVEHILYRVNELLPDDQQLNSVSPETLASDALRLMKRTGFSQLPVVHDGEVIGVFSHRSFADGVLDLERENRLHAEQLPVFDFLEQLTFADVNADVDEILDRLDQDNAVLVGSSSKLVGIATPMDALRYFHRVANAFLLLQEIERAIRILLQRGFSDAELSGAIARCTRGRARQGAETPTTIEKLSFGDYVQIIGDPDSWAHLQGVFGTSRELLSGAGEANGLWGAETVVVMSIDFAKQEDVAPALREMRWDLVVVDEAHAIGGQRERLVQQLSDSTSRLLLLAAVDESTAELSRAIPDLDVVRWDREITDAEGRKLFVAEARAYHVVEYIRSEEEVTFATDVLEFLDRRTVATDTPQVRLVKDVMSRALASSTSAIEQMLLRLRAQLTDNPYQDLWADPGRTDEHEADLSDEHPRIWREPQATGAIVDDLVTALEALPRDSKAERLQLLVEELADVPRARTCILSSFASTVEYLTEILAESGQRIHTVVGSIPASERDEVVRGFLHLGGVLLSTDGVAQRLNLALAQDLIHYDLPASRLRMEQRWGRLDRVGQEHTVHSYALRDERGSIQAEEELLRDRGFIE